MTRRGYQVVIEEMLARTKRQREGRVGAFEAPPPWDLPEIPDDIREKLIGEREATGFYISGHPLDFIRMDGNSSATTASVQKSKPGAWLTLVGVLTEVWVKPTRRGSYWGGAQLEDLEGVCQVIAFGDNAQALGDGNVVQVKGVTDTRDEQPALKITELKVLERW